MTEAVLNTQNWAALLRLELRAAADRTRMVPLERFGPLTVQRAFYPEQKVCHVYLLHPPGGVVGGDSLDLHLDLQPRTQALFTTPGAAKFYLSSGATAQVHQQFKLAAGAELEFLPQENIYFPGAQVSARTTLALEADSRLVFWEKHCFGRPANREFFATGMLDSQIDLRVSGRLIYTEKQRIDAAELQRSSGLRNHPVSASLLVYGNPLEQTVRRQLQELQPEFGICGISQPVAELLIARYLGHSTRDADNYFTRLWEFLRPLVMQREAIHPRIWNT